MIYEKGETIFKKYYYKNSQMIFSDQIRTFEKKELTASSTLLLYWQNSRGLGVLYPPMKRKANMWVTHLRVSCRSRYPSLPTCSG